MTKRTDSLGAARSAAIALCVAAAAIAAGCSDGAPQEPVAPPPDDVVSDFIVGTDDGVSDSPQKSYNTKLDKPAGTAIEAAADEKEDAADVVPNAAPTAGDATPESGASGDWSAEAPRLAGLAIGDAGTQVAQLLGQALDRYEMDDEGGALTVLEYDGMLVGLDGARTVKFVEISGSGVEAGLRGIAVGDTEDAAIKALGQPDNHTGYVLGYQAQDTMMKLDIDPDTSRILSIKLFEYKAP